MESDKTIVLRAFNKQFFDFFDDLLRIYPSNPEILTAKSTFETFKSFNPTSIIKVWYSSVYVPYKPQIDAGDVSFFAEKDYSTELQSNQIANLQKVLAMIDNVRQPIQTMDDANKAHSAKHIKNLSKLSEAYAALSA
jgi:hypothetical protein